MKDLLFVSHCLLNTAAKVKMYNAAEMDAEEALRLRLVTDAVRRGVQLIQLPCPEFTLYGARRWGHTADQFDNPFFRAHCRALLEPVLLQIQEYQAHGEIFRVLGVAGVDGSPSCGVRYTCRGPWGGNLGGRGDLADVVADVSLSPGMGVFMDELSRLLAQAGLSVRLEGLYAPEPERILSLLDGEAPHQAP